MDRNNGFALLRLISAILVLLTHSYVTLGRGPDPFVKLSHHLAFSSLGVDSFFAISGFLICASLMRNPSPWIYCRNRILRIVPALAVLTVLSVFLFGPLLTTAPDYWTNPETYAYLLNATVSAHRPFLTGVFAGNPITVMNGSIWTLPVEMACYLLLLVISRCRLLDGRFVVPLALAMLGLHLSAIFPRGEGIMGFEILSVVRFTALFLVGASLSTLSPRIAFSPLMAGVCAGLIILAEIPGARDWRYFSGTYILLWPYIVVSLGLSLKRFSWLNDYDLSYGCYLYAWPIQQCFVMAWGAQLGPRTLTLLVLPVDLLCAALSWFLVEKPALALKGKRGQFKRSAVPAPAQPIGS